MENFTKITVVLLRLKSKATETTHTVQCTSPYMERKERRSERLTPLSTQTVT